MAGVPRSNAIRDRLDEARGRATVLDLTLDVVEEDREIGGGILAGALAYRLFLFVLPLALLLIAVLGLLADWFNSSPRSVGRDTGLVGLVSKDVAAAADGRSGVWIALSALVVLGYATRVLYRAVGVVHALAWDHSAANARAESRSLRLFAVGVAAQVALLTTLSTRDLTSSAETSVATIGLVLGTSLVWLGVVNLLPHSSARWRDLLPGAVVFGVGILAIRTFDIYLLDFVHRSRSNAYGTLGAAAAVLLSLFFIGRLVVGSAILNATLFRRRTKATTAPEA
jgi:uncharacterized BrkB/YihY/UPF0761 family membrane protein